MKFNVVVAPEKRKDKNGIIISENVPIFADIRFSGTRFFYFTGYRVNVNWDDKSKGSWDFSECLVRKNSKGTEGSRIVNASDINSRLKKIKAELELFFQPINTTTKQEIIALLDEACKKALIESQPPEENDFFKMFDKYLHVSKFSYDRTKHVKSIINQWKRYEAKREIEISFNNVTVDLLRDFEKYLKEESTKPRSTRKPEEQVPSPKGKNTIHKILAMTRAFWNFAKKDLKEKGIEIHYPFGKEGYTIPGDTYGAPIYISSKERDILFNANLSSDRLKRVRDIFVFQCLIGARVGDLRKLTKANFQNGILSYLARKTKEKHPVVVHVPLNKDALEILSRYDLPDGRLLPFISGQRYNDYLKEVFKEAEITRIVTRKNPTSGEPEQVYLSDIISNHGARKAFIGNLYGKVDSGIISSMSGHIQGSKAFTRYYNVSEELQKKAIDLL